MRFARFVILVAFLVPIIPGSGLAAASGLRVAILPFSINAETGRDYAFMQKGISAMLSSRLLWPPKVDVVALDEARKAAESIEGFSGDSAALLVAGKLRADYVLYGSVTILGQSVSLDAKLLDVSGQKPPKTFFQQCNSMDEVIPAVNRFATEVNSEIFGRQPAAVVRAKGAAGSGGQPEPAKQGAARMHPDKIIDSPSDSAAVSGGGVTAGSSSLNPAFIVPEGRTGRGREFWKSRTFNKAINAIAFGDIDADGRIETLLATRNKVVAYRVTGRRMVKAYQVMADKGSIIIGLDVADINSNGMPEIFVSCLNSSRNRARSAVLEYDGTKFKTLVSKSAWYYRVVKMAGGGSVLFGQHQKTASDDLFAEPVFMLGWENGRYAKQELVLGGGKANVLGFGYGDITGDGTPVAVAYDRADRLEIVSKSGTVQWKGSQRYGGSTLYFVLPKTEPGSVDLQYYPMRLLVTDLDGDGKTDVIAAKNYDVAGNLLKNFRSFKDVHLESFSWDGLGLASNWKTRKISGHIRDFGTADFDQDGNQELVAVVIISEGRIIGTQPRSAVIAYELK